VKHRRRRKLRWALGIMLMVGLLAGGAHAVWTYLLPHEATVPTVVGLTVKDAQRRLEDVGLVVRLTKGEYSPTIVEGIVLQARPDEGATLTEGDRVTLVPSLGHAPVTVPDVIGKSLEKAKDQLRDADLRTGKVSHAYSDRFTAGQVMRQSAAPDSDAPYQSEVRLVISDGPAPVPIPNVVGKPRAQATATLEGLGFVVDASEDYSDDVADGRVISQDPAAGDLQPGQTVSILVSLGPPVFPVPDLVGMTRDAAVARIAELGLRPSVIALPGATGELTVASQIPLAGKIVRVGTTITIYVA
jgi:eukaryotic-like serine/threonine-protein kinase